jgi:hypothetical protein
MSSASAMRLAKPESVRLLRIGARDMIGSR